MTVQFDFLKLLSRPLTVSLSLLLVSAFNLANIESASAIEIKADSDVAPAAVATLSDEELEKEFALPLDNLEDIGYTLQRVQQQAIDLYVEATRKKRETRILSKSLVIPHEKLQPEGFYQPLRKAWLVFFVGTMEPLVQLLVHDVHEVEEHLSEVKVVAGKQKQFDQVYSQWRSAITSVNHHIDVLAEQIQAPNPSNIIVANEAKEIDSDITKAMQLRLKAYDILTEAAPASKAN